jgi:hypothetical protein
MKLSGNDPIVDDETPVPAIEISTSSLKLGHKEGSP